MRKILITTSSFGKHDKLPIQKLEESGFTAVFNPYKRKLSSAEVKKLILNHQPVGLIAGVEPLNADTLDQASKLQVISRCGIGLDNVDLEFAHKNSIEVANTPDGPTIAVAELTLGMILSLLRQIHRSDAAIRNGQWERPMGNLLSGKSIAVVGCGRIGIHLIELIQPFGCEVLGVDPIKNSDRRWRAVDLNEAISKADIVTLHLPYSKDNHHIIDESKLRLMKTSALLINASRGGLVDENALCNALSKGWLKGAALDCFESEPYQGPLADFSNVLLTGHIGSYAIESRINMEMNAVKNLLTRMDIE
jgi:D-3-phosphoglycerate dehydrogenase